MLSDLKKINFDYFLRFLEVVFDNFDLEEICLLVVAAIFFLLAYYAAIQCFFGFIRETDKAKKEGWRNSIVLCVGAGGVCAGYIWWKFSSI